MKNIIFGLDITDRSAEVVTLTQRKGALRVTGYAQAEIPPGTIVLGAIVDPDKLVKELARLFDNAFGQKRGKLIAGVSLPESLVYSKMFSLPATLTPELAEKAVAIEAADTFPIPIVNAVTSLTVTSRSQTTQDIFYLAAEREKAREYLEVLRRLDVQPLFFDAEPMALVRALIDPSVQDPVLIADVGGRSTILTMCDRGQVRMSCNVMVGGDSLTSAIEHKLGISLAKAEELRRRGGFDPGFDDGRLFLIMERPMNEIIEEIKRTTTYYETKTGRKVKAIVLAGGTSLTPQMVEYVGSNIADIPVVRGNPVRGVSLEGLPDPDSFARSSILWGTAIGLALRAIGWRASPGVNLLPAPKKQRGVGGSLDSIKNAFTNIIAMVTRKKPASKKKAAAHDEAAAPAPEITAAPTPSEPVRMQIDVAPSEPIAPATAPAMPAAAPAAESAVSALSDFMAKPAAAPAVAAPAAKEEKDFGSGIGDLLGDDTAVNPAILKAANAAAATGSVSAADESRRSIESILQNAPAVAQPKAARAVGGDGRKSAFPLIALALVCAIAAIGGIFMFVRKNGAPAFVTGMFEKKDVPEVVVPVTSVPETVNTVVMVSSNALPDEQRPVLLTRVIETDVSQKGTFPATGETTSVGGKASGKIVVTNAAAQTFNFVASTRFLSSSGVLFRLTTPATIPANGTVTVDVAADLAGPEGDIAASDFTIPGLSPALQKQVTGKSSVAMVGGSGKSKAVTAEDLAAAKVALSEKLKEEAKANFDAILVDGELVQDDLVTSSELTIEAPKAGDAAAEFTMTLSLRFRALLIPEGKVAPLLESALQAAAPSDASSFALGAPLYTVQAYDSVAEKAEIRVEAPISKR